jgi:tripartite-type tricarboxylate transporter receptor subunit TctC
MLRRSALVAGILLAASVPVCAQAWPSKPVRVVVAGTAGAAADAAARLLAEALTRELGRPVVVDPKPGGAGAIAVNELLAAPRDGHTVLVAVNSLVSEVPHVVKQKHDMARAVRPLAEIARGGLVLVATPSLPVDSVAALVAHARARPGQLSYASYSPGTMSHILGIQFARAAGIEWTHIGYKGSTPALADVMGGHVPLMFDGIPTALPLIRAGKLRALAVSTPARSPLLPQVPTFGELGYRPLEAVAWIGLWTAPEVPADVQERLRGAVLKMAADPAQQARLRELGFEPGRPRSVEELSEALRTDSDKVAAILKSIGFKPE